MGFTNHNVLVPSSRLRNSSDKFIMPRKAEAAKAPINLDEPPKKARGAYILYSMDARPQVVAANPEMKVTEVMKVLGSQWRTSMTMIRPNIINSRMKTRLVMKRNGTLSLQLVVALKTSQGSPENPRSR